ncbi:SpoVR family protein [Bacillus pacificus]
MKYVQWKLFIHLVAYGMPTRFRHWSFGKQFFRMKLQYDLGLSNTYELGINSIHVMPLLDTNSLIQIN